MLKKLTKIEAYFINIFDENKVLERLAKNMKRFIAINSIVGTGLTTSTAITGGFSISTFASGIDLPVGISLGKTNLSLTLATVIIQNFFKIFTVKQENMM